MEGTTETLRTAHVSGVSALTSDLWVKLSAKARGFLLHRSLRLRKEMSYTISTGLESGVSRPIENVYPNKRSPSSRMFLAAFKSLS